MRLKKTIFALITLILTGCGTSGSNGEYCGLMYRSRIDNTLHIAEYGSGCAIRDVYTLQAASSQASQVFATATKENFTDVCVEYSESDKHLDSDTNIETTTLKVVTVRINSTAASLATASSCGPR